MELNSFNDFFVQLRQTAINFGMLAGGIWTLYRYSKKSRAKIDEFMALPKDVAALKANTADLTSIRELANVSSQMLAENRKREEIRNEAADVAEFQSDHNGKFTWVSREFCRLIGGSAEECLGWNWLNRVSESDREHVEKAWTYHVRFQIPFKMTICWVDSYGAEQRTNVSAGPLVTGGPESAFYGVVHPAASHLSAA